MGSISGKESMTDGEPISGKESMAVGGLTLVAERPVISSSSSPEPSFSSSVLDTQCYNTNNIDQLRRFKLV